MSRAVALIRGVGGSTALKMADLREVATGTGLTGVATLQVAGNVVFDVPDDPLDGVADRLRAAMRDRFGHDLAVITRTHDELVDSVERHPYVVTHPGNLVTTCFMATAPAPEAAAALDPDRSPGDVFTVDGREIFLRFATGQATSKLQLPWFERGLQVVGTARNANTVAKLVDMTAPLSPLEAGARWFATVDPPTATMEEHPTMAIDVTSRPELEDTPSGRYR